MTVATEKEADYLLGRIKILCEAEDLAAAVEEAALDYGERAECEDSVVVERNKVEIRVREIRYVVGTDLFRAPVGECVGVELGLAPRGVDLLLGR